MEKLERSRGDRVLFGVCGGLGRATGVDADVVRVVWIFGTLLGGIGLLPYVAAVFLVPEEPGDPERAGDRMTRNLGLVLIAVAGLTFLRQLGLDEISPWLMPFWSWRFLVPLAVLLSGILLVWPDARRAIGISSEGKLRRSVSDRVLAGVLGGIAHQTRWDPNLVRIAFVLATVLTSGLAALLYLLLVLVLPEEPAPGQPDQAEGSPGR